MIKVVEDKKKKKSENLGSVDQNSLEMTVKE